MRKKTKAKPEAFEVDLDSAGQRLDLFIASKLPDCSRNEAQRLIEGGHVHPLNPSRPLKSSMPVKLGQRFAVAIPEPAPTHLKAQAIPLDVVFEDDAILVVNKPVGMVVHPGAGNPEGTLVNAVLAHCPDIDGVGGQRRPGLVHRLDKDTSGLIVIAKNGKAFKGLTRQIVRREMRREYVGIVRGELKGSGTIEAPLGRDPQDRKKMAVRNEEGKEAVTHFKVLESGEKASLAHFKLETGRTHQIRVHSEFIAHPILGDHTYHGESPLAARQMLHAFRLTITHPTLRVKKTFTAAPPRDFEDCLKSLDIRVPDWKKLVWKDQV